MRFWEGKGYSEEYTNLVDNLLPKIKEELIPITITFKADTLCKACPHLVEGKCDSQDKVLVFDKKVTELCDLKDGQRVTWNEMFDLVTTKIMNEQGLFKSICSNCSWADICHK
ncbi:MAG: DUF1284 domain-containing protein [Sphaerochaetaceae bacterium]|nr:DUF1284 domain-containing protein [Sphaerochaetaceae bacterium]